MKIKCGLLLGALLLLCACGSDDPIEELISHLRSDFGNRREKACKRLGQLGAEAAKAVPALRKVLRTDRSDYVRRCAAEALGKMAPFGVAAFPELTQAFKDRSGGVRMAASEAMGRYKEKALPALKKLIYGKDGYMQMYALRSLKHVGPKALPLLAHAAKSRYLQVLQTASETLIDIGRRSFSPPKTEALRKAHGAYFKTLFVLLRVRNAKIRRHVSWALSELGPHGAKASAALCEQLLAALDGVLESAPNQVKMYAAYALRQLGKRGVKDAQTRRHLQGSQSWPGVLKRLLQLRTDPTWYIRKHAVSAMGWMLQALQPSAKQSKAYKAQYKRHQEKVFTGMEASLNDPTWDVRYEVTRALRRVGSAKAILAFLRIMRSRNPERREHSAQTLGWMGRQAAIDKGHEKLLTTQLLPTLHRGLTDSSKGVRKAAMNALVAIGAPAALWLYQRHTKGNMALRVRRYRIFRKLKTKGLPPTLARGLTDWSDKADKTPLLQWHVWRGLRHLQPLPKGVCMQALGQLGAAGVAKVRAAIARLSRCTASKGLVAALWKLAMATKDAQGNTRALLALSMLSSAKELTLTPAQQEHLASWGVAKAPHQQRARLIAMGHMQKRPELSWLVLVGKALRSAHKGVRDGALHALQAWPIDPQTAPLLQRAAQDNDGSLRRKGIAALGRPFPLKGQPHHAMRLGWRITETKTLPLLQKLLRHRDGKTRLAAIKAMEKLPLVYTLSIMPWVLQALRDRDAAVRAQALHALAWQVPHLLQGGWTISFLKAALQMAKPPLSLQQIRSYARKPRKERPATKKTFSKYFKAQKTPSPRITKLAKSIYKAIAKGLDDPSAYVRKYAVFALGNIGKFASAKEKKVLLRHLINALGGRRKPQVKRNVCWVLGQWLAPHHTGEMIKAMHKVQLDPKQSKATRTQCERAVYQLKSDDKPYVLWVNHPRSPTLETFAPENLYPSGP